MAKLLTCELFAPRAASQPHRVDPTNRNDRSLTHRKIHFTAGRNSNGQLELDNTERSVAVSRVFRANSEVPLVSHLETKAGEAKMIG